MNKKIIRTFCYTVTFFIALVIMMSCDSMQEEKRGHKAEKAKGDIIIGAVAPWSSMVELLWNGIELAVDEINREGGVLGRKIRIIKEDDEGSVQKGRIVAQRFANNLDMIAVIGHFNSFITIPVSSTYEFSNMIMLSPSSTSPKLTRQGFKYIFRNIPNDNEIGRQLADFAFKQGYRRLAVYYENNAYGLGLANGFESRVEETGENINIVERISYNIVASNRSYQNVLRNWKDLDLDAIFLAGSTPKAANIIQLIRKLGIKVPILGGDGLDSPELLTIGGEAAEGTVVAVFFNPLDPAEEVTLFTESFNKRYGIMPDTWAAQAYDAVKVLANAIKITGSTVPDKIAETLHATKNWKGVTGKYSFDENGDIVGRGIILSVVKNNKFEFFQNKLSK